MKIIRFIIIVLVIFSFSSCQNYESEKYIKMENEAINDIILEITCYEEMKRLNSWKNRKLKLYLISQLDNNTSYTDKPTDTITLINNFYLSEKEIAENTEKYEREEKLFEKLKKGKIQKRNLKYKFTNEKLNIVLIEPEKYLGNKTIKNEFGYLFISRIIFEENFTKGYLHFSFFCGEGCAWNSNIEIKKINGKWKISESFSGGIA